MAVEPRRHELGVQGVIGDIHHGIPVPPQLIAHQARAEVVHARRLVLRSHGEVAHARAESSTHRHLPVGVGRQRPHATRITEVPELGAAVGGGRGEEVVSGRGMRREGRDLVEHDSRGGAGVGVGDGARRAARGQVDDVQSARGAGADDCGRGVGGRWGGGRCVRLVSGSVFMVKYWSVSVSVSRGSDHQSVCDADCSAEACTANGEPLTQMADEAVGAGRVQDRLGPRLKRPHAPRVVAVAQALQVILCRIRTQTVPAPGSVQLVARHHTAGDGLARQGENEG